MSSGGKRDYYEVLGVQKGAGKEEIKGAYRKLRLAPQTVTTALERAGFEVERHQAPGGMVALVGIAASPRRL